VERQTTQEQVIGYGLDGLKNSMYFRVPGVVQSYDAATMTATVLPMVNDCRFDLDTGAVVFEPWQPIQNVPVAWPRFGGGPGTGFVIAGPLEAGDQVDLEAYDLDISTYRAQGRSSNPVNPADTRRHGGNYWKALPVDMTGPAADAGASGNAMIIGRDGDVAQIRISTGTILLGRTGGDFVALASKVDANTNLVKALAAALTTYAADAAAAWGDLGTGAAGVAALVAAGVPATANAAATTAGGIATPGGAVASDTVPTGSPVIAADA
jgi:hypothetical protein